MARTVTDDLVQSFQFQVKEAGAGGFLDTAAGFNNVTTPEVSVEVAEYREGIRKYTIKQPGVPTVESTTLQRGIAQPERTFADWMLAKVLGGETYRTDLQIEVYPQSELDKDVDKKVPIRTLLCKEAFPSRVKLVGDLDATTSDINIQEIEAAVEEVELIKPA